MAFPFRIGSRVEFLMIIPEIGIAYTSPITQKRDSARIPFIIHINILIIIKCS